MAEAKYGYGDPTHKKYPVNSEKQWNSAWNLRGHSKDVSPSTVEANLLKIARTQGYTLPDSYTSKK